jgi:hypothetical protein
MKIKFIVLVSIVFFYGCTEKVNIYYQKNKDIAYEIKFENLKNKVISVGSTQYNAYGYINITSNGKELFKGYLYLNHLMISSKNTLDNHFILFCNDKNMFNEVNYLNNINLDCLLYENTDKNLSLNQSLKYLEKKTLVKFKIE